MRRLVGVAAMFAAMLVAVGSLALPSIADAASRAPVIEAAKVSHFTVHSVTVKLTVDPEGQATRIRVVARNGTGAFIAAAAEAAGDGRSPVRRTVTIKGIPPHGSFYLRAYAGNASGVTQSKTDRNLAALKRLCTAGPIVAGTVAGRNYAACCLRH